VIPLVAGKIFMAFGKKLFPRLDSFLYFKKDFYQIKLNKRLIPLGEQLLRLSLLRDTKEFSSLTRPL
jgi:hypothetical protein